MASETVSVYFLNKTEQLFTYGTNFTKLVAPFPDQPVSNTFSTYTGLLPEIVVKLTFTNKAKSVASAIPEARSISNPRGTLISLKASIVSATDSDKVWLASASDT